MGNSVLDGSTRGPKTRADIHKFYTSAAWIEGRAEDQLNHIAGFAGVKHVAAFPDLHPGKYGPVGCALLADRIYPQLIGSDIGCGMSLFQLDLAPRKIKIEKLAWRMRDLGEMPDIDQSERLDEADLPADLFDTALGTLGGGNHFCELQTIADTSINLDRERLYLLVHSGSRGFGNQILEGVLAGAYVGMSPDSPEAREYVAAHNQAVLWARLNRQIIAERAAAALRTDLRLIVDAPHNLLTHEGGGWLHRKGAAKADGQLVPLAGSRATPSYILQTTANADALNSVAHGAGRKFNRSSMHGRVRAKKSDIAKMLHTKLGGRVICEDKALLVEEAPQAYKSAKSVVADLEITGVAHAVATLHPLVTFKKTRTGVRL